MERRRGAHLPFQAIGGYTTESVTHGQCDVRPTASLPFGRYQFVLLGEQRHMCVNNLHRFIREAERPGLEPLTSWLQVRRPDHYAILTLYLVVIYAYFIPL